MFLTRKLLPLYYGNVSELEFAVNYLVTLYKPFIREDVY